MAITKTDFLNYIRCPRYIALEDVKKNNLLADVSYGEYDEKEKLNKLSELYDSMYEEVDDLVIDKTKKIDKQLDAMLVYYKKVEELAAKLSLKEFGGKIIYSSKTEEQKSYSFTSSNARYLCFVDVYNENNDNINIIEVKATTSKKYLQLESGMPKSPKYSIWTKINNVYHLKDEVGYDFSKEMEEEKYNIQKNKLYNRFGLGKYLYDIAVQRFIIEGSYKESKESEKLQNIHYYLAVLNHQYCFDGLYVDNEPVYDKDSSGNEIITFFDVTKITEELVLDVKKEALKLEKNLQNPDISPCPLGPNCRYKKNDVCKYFQTVCASIIPLKNSSLTYLHSASGFKMENGKTIKGLDLINNNYLHMLDVPLSWLHNPNHLIQREVVETKKEYINKNKIRKALDNIEYPIYHLDFETFPCPLPRFKGEFPYIQSPFEFSLHIEKSPGVCDEDKDNIIFLAKTFGDEREELIKTLLSNVDVNKGTLFAQNVSFEKGRIEELAKIFPQYQEDLIKLKNRGYDLLWLLNNNQSLYQKLGFNEEECKEINYYHEDLNGSYSIKKTLPIFSDLTYQNLDVKNGTEAIVVYANYNSMSDEERDKKQSSLRVYCKQDTWAMVKILSSLRKKIK